MSIEMTTSETYRSSSPPVSVSAKVLKVYGINPKKIMF